MKNIYLFILFTSSIINANFNDLKISGPIDVNNQVVESIRSNDYDSLRNILSGRLISARSIIDGKPLLIHAVINDKPDMVNLLIRYGAQPYEDYCDQGFNATEWAVKSGSYYARAELIVLSIFHN